MSESVAPAVRPVKTLLLLTGDLFFAARLKGIGEAAGYRVRSGLSEQAIDADGTLPDRVVVDLTNAKANVERLSSRLGDDAAARISAYAPHVRVDLLRAARAAGLTAVFTRSQIDDEMPRWLSGPSA